MIKYLIKLFIFFFMVCLNHIAFANTTKLLSSYTDLVQALAQGDSVRAIMLINKCSITKTAFDSNEVIAGMNFSTFNKYAIHVGPQQKDGVATSRTILVEASQLGPVYNYVRLRVFEDNTAEILSEYLDPLTYKKLDAKTANCIVSNGHDQNGLLLYDAS